MSGEAAETDSGIIDPIEETVSDTLARVERIRSVFGVQELHARSKHRRTVLWQKPLRGIEDRARHKVVEVHRSLVIQGSSASQVAAGVGLAPRTLKRWEAMYGGERGTWAPRGRPAERAPLETRQRLVGAMELLGPEVSTRRLQELFDDMARKEVEDMAERYRYLRALREPAFRHVLTWTCPGTVWAMDHAEPPGPVDGIHPAAFALRDLSSGYDILWEPVEDFEAESVIEWLDSRFRIWGAPLVLKSDSGSAFISEATEEFLLGWGVKHILSPPRRPPYNGSIEASIRWMKLWTDEQATAAGRGGAWRREDMDRARLRANTRARRRKAPAEDLWAARPCMGAELRAAFAKTVAEQEREVIAERGFLPARLLPPLLRRAVNRQAIGRALVAHDLLHFKRRRFPLPINPTIVDKNG
jgi:transposase InsO family protein